MTAQVTHTPETLSSERRVARALREAASKHMNPGFLMVKAGHINFRWKWLTLDEARKLLKYFKQPSNIPGRTRAAISKATGAQP